MSLGVQDDRQQFETASQDPTGRGHADIGSNLRYVLIGICEIADALCDPSPAHVFQRRHIKRFLKQPQKMIFRDIGSKDRIAGAIQRDRV